MVKKTMLIAAMIIFSAQFAFAQSAKEIMEKADRLAKPQTVKAEARMTIIRGGKIDESLDLKLFGKQYGAKTEKMLLEIGSPRNMKVLTHTVKNGEDKQWVKMRDGKKKPIQGESDRKKVFVGSHLFYEDLQSRDIADYDFKLLGEEKYESYDCYRIEALPHAGKSIYEKAVFFVIKAGPLANFILRADIFYEGYLYKRLVNYDIQVKSGVITPNKSVMYRLQKDGTESGRTVVEIKSLEYNVPVNESLFNPNSL